MDRKIQEDEEKKLKVSICQVCNGWIRVSALYYFQTNTKARNEFMREVAKHNLSVMETTLSEWNENNVDRCNCE